MIQGTLKKVAPQQFSKDDGTNAVTYKENADISTAHYQKLFDRSDSITPDPTVINAWSPLDISNETKDALS
jgi:hypothetical protein